MIFTIRNEHRAASLTLIASEVIEAALAHRAEKPSNWHRKIAPWGEDRKPISPRPIHFDAIWGAEIFSAIAETKWEGRKSLATPYGVMICLDPSGNWAAFYQVFENDRSDRGLTDPSRAYDGNDARYWEFWQRTESGWEQRQLPAHLRITAKGDLIGKDEALGSEVTFPLTSPVWANAIFNYGPQLAAIGRIETMLTPDPSSPITSLLGSLEGPVKGMASQIVDNLRVLRDHLVAILPQS